MKIDFKGLIEGVVNKHLGAQWKKEIAKQRYEDHCKNCYFNSEVAKQVGYQTARIDEHCLDCGCNLDYKTHCMHCSCPRKFWDAVVNEKDSQKINQIIEEDDNKQYTS